MIKSTKTTELSYEAPSTTVLAFVQEQCIAASVNAILDDMDNNILLREDF
ncbi:MAG: hypothetical protein K6F58_02350 [Bacteroidales bacterium]|nr:hypothetical protein [Bacteroidales bacterium]